MIPFLELCPYFDFISTITSDLIYRVQDLKPTFVSEMYIFQEKFVL